MSTKFIVNTIISKEATLPLIKKWFDDNFPLLSVIYNSTIINPFDLDIYIPDWSIAIDYNEFYWNNKQINAKIFDVTPDYYYIKKLNVCRENNITLYYIWGNDIIGKQSSLEKELSDITKKYTN